LQGSCRRRRRRRRKRRRKRRRELQSKIFRGTPNPL